MNNAPRKSAHSDKDWSDDLFSFLWMWCAFVAGALVLSWLFSEVNNFNQRGEQRELRQRADGALVLADETAKPMARDAVFNPADAVRVGR